MLCDKLKEFVNCQSHFITVNKQNIWIVGIFFWKFSMFDCILFWSNESREPLFNIRGKNTALHSKTKFVQKLIFQVALPSKVDQLQVYKSYVTFIFHSFSGGFRWTEKNHFFNAPNIWPFGFRFYRWKDLKKSVYSNM